MTEPAPPQAASEEPAPRAVAATVAPPAAALTRGGGILRKRSLLWIVPERLARWVSWLTVVVVCIGSVVLVAWLTRPKPPERHEAFLSELLTERLGMPVSVGAASRDDHGQYALSEVAVGDKGAVLRAKIGSYLAPDDDFPGRMILRGGKLTIDLEPWMKGRPQPIALILGTARRDSELRRIHLSDFSADVRLGPAVPLALADTSGRATLTDDGNLRAHLVGRTDAGKLKLTLEVTDDEQKLTVIGRALPFAERLLAPTLGGDLARLLKVSNAKLELLAGPSAQRAAGHNWTLEATGTLRLDDIPRDLGLGKLSGDLSFSIQALGRLDDVATLYVKLSLAEGTTATASSAALRNLKFLLTGAWDVAPADEGDHTLGSVNLSFFVVPRKNYLCIAGTNPDQPAGLLTPDAKPLLTIPLLDQIPIIDFKHRLDQLRLLWKKTHTS